jgi:hypothetical protein
MLTGVRTSGFDLRYLPYGWARLDGNPRRPDDCSNLPISVFGKKSWSLIEHWESSGGAAESSWRMQAGAVQSFSTQRKVRTGIHVARTDDALVWCASGRFDMSSKRLMHWTAGRPNGMTHHPDSWQGIEFSNLQTVQNLLETLLNSGIPVKMHLYNEVILFNRMRPITN